jgi:hypothetical protein
MRFLTNLLLVSVLVAKAALAATLVSPPSVNSSLKNVGFIIAGRSDVNEVEAYTNLATAFRQALGSKFNVYSSLVAASSPVSTDDVSSALSQMKGAGVDAQKTFVVAHSMSSAGIDLSAWVNSNSNQVGGLILLSAFLQRMYRPDVAKCLTESSLQPKKSLTCLLGCLADGSHDCYGPNIPSFPVPVLTVGGELDGVVRVTRIAEAYYSQTVLGKLATFPVVIVPGMSHVSLLSTPAPSAVVSQDLAAEITPSFALSTVAKVVAAWVSGDSASLQPYIQKTADLSAPIIDAFVNYEGSWWFTGGDDEHGSSYWAGYAQELMASPMPDGTNYAWATANEFHLVSDEETIPPYFRHKHRPNITVEGNTISSVSVSQLRFVKYTTEQAALGLNGDIILKEEKLGIMNTLPDDGSDYVSAIEISTKLASRQLVYNTTGVVNPPDSLDDGDRCKAINQAAYDWALNRAGAAAKTRFTKYGLPMVMQADKKPPIGIGPYWIWTYLDITVTATEADVTSYYAYYDLAANPYGAGNHYCKLLSPARALEWIYVDGLRANMAASMVA